MRRKNSSRVSGRKASSAKKRKPRLNARSLPSWKIPWYWPACQSIP